MNLVILTKPPKKALEGVLSTAERLAEEAKKAGVKCYLVDMEGAYIKDGRVHNINDDKGFPISKQDTVAVARAAITMKDSYLNLLTQFERLKVPTINTRECTEICADKYRTTLILRDNDVNQPKTVLMSMGPDKKINYAEQSFDKLKTKFPIILKTLRGTQGVGVMLVESLQSLDAITQLLYKMDESIDLLLQEYIKSEFDVRVMVLDNEIIGTMRRNVPDKDFRSNYSQGATTDKYELTEKEKEISLAAAKAVGGYWTGVDFIPNNDDPLIIEVNSSAGTEGIEGTTGTNINEIVVKYITDTNNIKGPRETCGMREKFEIPLYGETLKVKMDTGNSSTAMVLHAKDIEIGNDGKKVTWKFRGTKYRAPIVEIKRILTGPGDHIEDRATIELDLSFNGILHKNVLFTLDDRKDKLDILCSKRFMIDNNLIVDPSSKYLLS